MFFLFSNRAVALIHLGLFEDARKDLEESMELDAHLANSRLHMGYLVRVVLVRFSLGSNKSSSSSTFAREDLTCALSIAIAPLPSRNRYSRAPAVACVLTVAQYPSVYYLKSAALRALGMEEAADAEMRRCTTMAWQEGPYRSIFVHLLPVKYVNYKW